ncbi:IS1182 family transposase [Nocardia sp. CA-151230]|uniref:IS1182 family transposase n=1 Tax=Nocardia sp. CA-151230 TaxID=3239982 RepID=UPI003D939B65
MQGECGSNPELMDAAALVGHLVPAGSVFAFLAEHRREVFPAAMFEDLFPSRTGRPSLPGEVAASVMVLQALHDLSDRETVAALRCDLRWKVACGLALDDAGFDASTLTYWRRRLARSQNPNRIFDAVRAVVAETGVLQGKTRRALDSVVLDDAVATQDTVTQLIAAIRRVRREVPGAAAVIAAQCHAHDYDDPGKPAIAWDDTTAREALVSALVNDATAVVNALAGTGFDDAVAEKASQALALLALVAGQDVEPAEGSDGTDGRWRIARRVAEDRVISVVDPEARHVHKTVHNRQDGYKAHVAVEPDTGLFTDGSLTRGAGGDNHEAVVGLRLLASEDGPREVLGDNAYGTGDLRAELSQRGHTAIIKPAPLRPAVEGGFTLDEFTFHNDATVTCPNGVTRSITAKYKVVFGIACRDCPLRARCTASKSGRTLNLHRHHRLLRHARRDWHEQPELVETYRQHRPMVERSISWLVGPKGRCRKLRYRGTSANDHWLHRRMAALNLRRLLNLGLTNTAGTWAIA